MTWTKCWVGLARQGRVDSKYTVTEEVTWGDSQVFLSLLEERLSEGDELVARKHKRTRKACFLATSSYSSDTLSSQEDLTVTPVAVYFLSTLTCQAMPVSTLSTS